MSEHRLTDEGIRKALRAARIRTITMFAIIEGFLFWFAFSRFASFNDALVMLLSGSLVLAVTSYNGQKRVRGQLTSYLVRLDEDRIRRDIQGMPTVEVARADVSAIEERHPGGLAVYGRDRRDFVGVNEGMDGYATIRKQLAGWRAFDEKPPAKGIAPIAAGVLSVVAFGVTILSHNRNVVAVIGSLLVIGLVVSGVMLYRSPHVDRKTKRLLFYLVMPLAAIIVRVVLALAGPDFPD